MSGTPVWVGQELEVKLFKFNASGVPMGISNMFEYNPLTDTPFAEYCFWKSAAITKTLEHTSEPSTDRPVKEIVPGEYIYDCSITAMHCLQEEFNSLDIFNRKNRWLIVFYNYAYASKRVRINEQMILYRAVAVGGSLNNTENGISEIGSLKFKAEDFFEANN